MKTNSFSPRALEVQFRHMPKLSPVNELVRQQADRLGRFDLSGSRCEIVIDEMHHWNKGRIFKVSIRLTVPGKRLFVAHAEEKSDSHEYLNSAVRLAFDEIERQLEKRRKRNQRRQASKFAA